jgi:excisionase family DNA binding protein
MSDEAEIMTMSEVCGYLRVHPSTIYRLLKNKELPGFRVGADWPFRREEIDRWRRAQGDIDRGDIRTVTMNSQPQKQKPKTGWQRAKEKQPIRVALSPAARERRRQWLLDTRERLHRLEWHERGER